MSLPILWSFRRCPYAMRARLAVVASGVTCALREVVLRDKPQAFLDASPSATVPCLQTEGAVIDESYDIMFWALGQHDPEGWLDMPQAGHDLIQTNDGPFKAALDHYKYASRYEGIDGLAERAAASEFLDQLNTQLGSQLYLFGDTPKLADMAILPFVRQFAHVDLNWFNAQDWPVLIGWLDRFKSSERFTANMSKYPQWQPGSAVTVFP